MDKGEKSAENDEKGVDLGEKKDDAQEETIKHYAESTMNELLSIFGYDDKINSADTEKLDLKQYTDPRDRDGSDVTHDEESDEERESSGSLKLRLKRPLSNGTAELDSQHRSLLAVLKRKEAEGASEELTITEKSDDTETPCVWCRKSGRNQYIVKSADGVKSFCSEVCFLQCRRASFKKSKVCDWCKHVRHTSNYLEFHDGDAQLQFCSEKCLNQYKMSIFCKETEEHLRKIKTNGEESETERDGEKGILITPDLWLIGEQLSKLKGAKGNTDDKVSANTDSGKPLLINNIDKSARKMTDSKSFSDLQKQSLLERIKAEANLKHKRLQARKDSERAPPATSASEPSTSPRPGSLAQASPQMYHPAMAPWIHQAQLLGSMGGQSLGPYGAYSSVMLPGLMPPYPPEIMTELAKAAERGKEATSGRDKRIKTEPGETGVQTSPHSERSAASASSRRAHLLDVPSTETVRSSTSPRTSLGNNRQPSSLFPVDFPQMFSAQNFPGQVPPGFPAQQPQRVMGNGIPPVTMMVPFPVLLPLPVPIPIPIPLTMDTLIKHFQPDGRNTSNVKPGNSSDDDKDYRPYIGGSKYTRPAATHSPLSVSSNDELRYGNDTRSGSRSSCPDLSSSYNYVSPSLSDVSILKRSRTPDETGSLDLSKRAKQPKIESLHYDSSNGAINLSTKYRDRDHSSNENLSENASSNEEDADDKNSTRDSNDNLTDVSEIVPKIHIVTHAETRPLSQHLPLPPTEHKYANRRGLILDAPVVPKKKRSPSPERPNYVRNIPRDLLEAARRRSLRHARNTIRTK